jgi:hypothetical protein
MQNGGDVRGCRRVVDLTPRSSSGADVEDALLPCPSATPYLVVKGLSSVRARSQTRQARDGTDVPYAGPSGRTAMTWAREPTIGGSERCQVR